MFSKLVKRCPPTPMVLAALCSLMAVCLAGCQGDEIQRYQVPKPETYPEPEAKVRLLAAIFPAKDQTWFFKFMGPSAAVKEHQAAFDRFVRSVRFTDREDEPITWTLPEGWKYERGKDPLTYGTFRFGTPDKPSRVTLSVLGKEFGSLLDNINRWRGQIGLKPAPQSELTKLSKMEEVNGVQAIFVDMGGPGGGNMGMGR